MGQRGKTMRQGAAVKGEGLGGKNWPMESDRHKGREGPHGQGKKRKNLLYMDGRYYWMILTRIPKKESRRTS